MNRTIDKPTEEEAQEAINILKPYLLGSEIKISFPLSSDIQFDLRLTRRVTREQFKRMVEVIQLAEESCIVKEPNGSNMTPTDRTEANDQKEKGREAE